jgi:hypothetical protein
MKIKKMNFNQLILAFLVLNLFGCALGSKVIIEKDINFKSPLGLEPSGIDISAERFSHDGSVELKKRNTANLPPDAQVENIGFELKIERGDEKSKTTVIKAGDYASFHSEVFPTYDLITGPISAIAGVQPPVWKHCGFPGNICVIYSSDYASEEIPKEAKDEVLVPESQSVEFHAGGEKGIMLQLPHRDLVSLARIEKNNQSDQAQEVQGAQAIQVIKDALFLYYELASSRTESTDKTYDVCRLTEEVCFTKARKVYDDLLMSISSENSQRSRQIRIQSQLVDDIFKQVISEKARVMVDEDSTLENPKLKVEVVVLDKQ